MLLDDRKLHASSVVANNAMNRERQLTGVNSYAKELGFDPLSRLGRPDSAWLDICCGSGRALRQAAERLAGVGGASEGFGGMSSAAGPVPIAVGESKGAAGLAPVAVGEGAAGLAPVALGEGAAGVVPVAVGEGAAGMEPVEVSESAEGAGGGGAETAGGRAGGTGSGSAGGSGSGSVGGVTLVGVDLVGGVAFPGVTMVEAAIESWVPERRFDLITCVHGLHYVGDKLGVLERVLRWLTPGGSFVADLDLASVRVGAGEGRRLARMLRDAGVDYDARRRRVTATGPRELRLPYRYLGADDKAGPNYTGQPAVNSYYEREG